MRISWQLAVGSWQLAVRLNFDNEAPELRTAN
jgi:hypothetical protein